MKLVVVIVTFNSQKVIGTCLKSVFRQRKYQVVVVDNNSQDKTVHFIKQKFPQVKLIKLTSNLGFSGGNNVGIDFALQQSVDFVLILNPDTQVLPGCFNSLIKAAKSYHDRGIFGPKIYSRIYNQTSITFLHSSMSFLRKRESKIPDQVGNDNKRIIWSAGGYLDKKRFTAGLIGHQQPDKQQFNQIKTCDFVSGTCLLIPAKLLQLGLRFYQPYFMYYEDVEFCLKAKQLGFPSYYVPHAQIIHDETSQHTRFSNLKKYYLARNHLLFVERNAPIRVKLREMVRLLKTIWQHWRKHDFISVQGVIDYITRHFESL